MNVVHDFYAKKDQPKKKNFHIKHYHCKLNISFLKKKNPKIIFQRGSKSVKGPKHVQRNVFMLQSPRKIEIELATNKKIDKGIFTFLSNNSNGYVTSRFRSGAINKFSSGWHRLWLEILNKSFEDTIEIKNGEVIGFFVQNLNI